MQEASRVCVETWKAAWRNSTAVVIDGGGRLFDDLAMSG